MVLNKKSRLSLLHTAWKFFSDDYDGENVMKKILMGKTKKVNI